MKKLIFVRPGEINTGINEGLSPYGVNQIERLAKKIKESLMNETFVIWYSEFNQAKKMTANIIIDVMGRHKKGLYDKQADSKLDRTFNLESNFDWLDEKINLFTGENLIVVVNPSYFEEYPRHKGFEVKPSSESGSCFILEDGKCISLLN